MARVVCTSCGTVGEPRSITKGSVWLELGLWLFFLVPGLLYSIWRISSRYKGCRVCRSRELVPVDSPVGQRLVREGGAAPRG